MDELMQTEAPSGSSRNIRFLGFVLFICGPLLFLFNSRILALNRMAPPLLIVPLAFAAMAAGGFMMLMGTERCVACERRRLFFPGGQFGDDWVCPDCLSPYENPVVIHRCDYCGSPWEIRNPYERHLAWRPGAASRCPSCGAPAEPAMPQAFPE